MIESIGELDKQIRKELGFTDDDMNRYILFEEHENHFIVKYKRWLAPSVGGLRLKDFLVEALGAKYEPYPKARFIIEKGREVEVSEAKKETPKEMSKTGPQPVTVKLSQLQYGKFSPRKTNKKWIEHLKEAIQNEGAESFPKPKVRIHPDAHNMAKTQYQLVDGEHFCRALEELGIKEAKVEVFALTDEEADYKAMRFNQVHGKPLEPIEEARHLKKMMGKYNLSQEQVAKKFLRSQQWVSKRLAMLELPETNVTTRVVTSTHAEEIAKVPQEDREAIVDKVEEEELSTRETQAVVDAIKEQPEKKEQVLTSHGAPKLTRCGFPGCQKGAYFPIFYGNVPVCPDCDRKIKENPSLAEKLGEKSSVPERTLKKTYDVIKPTREEREALMHPKESKMDWEMFELLKNDPKVKEHGYTVQFQKEYILLRTISDVTLVKPGDEIAVYWDHVKTHKNRENRDSYLRGLLEKHHHGTRALGFDYRDNTKKSVEELLRKVHDELR